MGSFGLLEMIVLLVAGILIFGGDLPDVGRKIGRIWGKIQHYISMLQEDIEQETATVQDRIEIEEATEEPYYSRQQSPETKTPDAYKDEESEHPDAAEENKEDDDSQRFLSDVIDEKKDVDDPPSDGAVDDDTEA